MLASVLDAFEDGSPGARQKASWGRAVDIEGEIERKLEFSAHGRDATDDVCTVDGAAVPSVHCNHGGFDPNKVCAAIGAGNGDGFVETGEEAFDTDSFMIATGSRVETDAEECTSIRENAIEAGTASIHGNEAMHTNFQKDFLE